MSSSKKKYDIVPPTKLLNRFDILKLALNNSRPSITPPIGAPNAITIPTDIDPATAKWYSFYLISLK